jgi:hypothetical protein
MVNHNLPNLLARLGVGVGLPDLVERKRAIVHEWAQVPLPNELPCPAEELSVAGSR